jgi:hypothetical protein
MFMDCKSQMPPMISQFLPQLRAGAEESNNGSHIKTNDAKASI